VDVEKTIEFILQQAAKTDAILEQLAESHKLTEAQLRQTDLLLKRAIRAAVKEARAERRRRAEGDAQLQAAQQRTEAALAAFIESMRRGGNGQPKG
jgi:hypothetical protein